MKLYLTLEELDILRAGLVMLRIVHNPHEIIYQKSGALLDLINVQAGLWIQYIHECRAITRKERTMKVLLMGFQPVDYTNKNNRHVLGVSLYYAAENPNTVGLMTDSTWIPAENKTLYEQVLALPCTGEPIPAEMNFDFQIGSRYPTLVDIKVNTKQAHA